MPIVPEGHVSPRPVKNRLWWPAVGLAALTAVTGCGSQQDPAPAAGPVKSSAPATATPGVPENDPADLLSRARAAMDAGTGWTFAVTGEESLELTGAPKEQGSAASYSATVERTGSPEALHQSGTVLSKGKRKAEEVFAVDGTGYVRKGAPGAPWTKGPLTDPEIAAKVEDPLAALASFAAYAERDERIEVTTVGGEIRLRLRIPAAHLADRTERPAVAKAAREFRPTLDKLRKAGVTAGEERIVLTGLEEVLVLDARTHRMASYRSSFGFAVPHEGRQLRYEQELRADTRGSFTGRIEVPAAAR
ncbi:hypothetical protein [Streptomyces sp. NK15101]|uniref:hypothetical protein n=1 Tax=Streptomyces sp. NK15101 TaxID=2873261 RepID=UPI001CED3484|nr:hypothetical protein [Streptomyces sp. NK15101]